MNVVHCCMNNLQLNRLKDLKNSCHKMFSLTAKSILLKIVVRRCKTVKLFVKCISRQLKQISLTWLRQPWCAHHKQGKMQLSTSYTGTYRARNVSDEPVFLTNTAWLLRKYMEKPLCCRHHSSSNRCLNCGLCSEWGIWHRRFLDLVRHCWANESSLLELK